jgi:hypothetical protein
MEYLNPAGGCVFPADPFEDPGCGGSNWVGSTPTEFGCLYHVSEVECLRFEGTWMLPAITKAECLAYGLGCEITTGTFTSYRNPGIVSRVNPRNCRSCGDKVVPIMGWQPGVWMEPIPRKLSWRKRELVQKFKFEKTLSFPTVFDDVNTAINLEFGFLLLAEAQCRFSKIMELLETIACTCSSSPSSSTSSDCYGNFQREVPSGTVAVCPGENATLSTPPAKIKFNLGSKEERLEGCSNVTVSFISAMEFKTPQEVSLSSYLISPQKPESDFGFLNGNKAEIGQVFADGILLAVSGKKLKSVYVCITERGDVALDYNRFSIYDFAIPGSDDRELVPLELEVEILEGGFFCAEIENPAQKPYYPVLRLNNWEEAIPYTHAEVILMYVTGGIYAVVAAFAFLQLFEFIIYRKLKFQMNHHIVWMLFLLNFGELFFFTPTATEIFPSSTSLLFTSLSSFISTSLTLPFFFALTLQFVLCTSSCLLLR